MPTLNWIGKEKVVSHHQDVPYRVLEHKYHFDADKGETNSSPLGRSGGAGNKIIHGDNLEALKSLLPEYEGKIKCIYIDPPYNTGNESWVYNDNVNHPKIKKWLGEVVGKDGEDLTRHDKWLCMMYPRLKLLHKLLAEDGAIFISIDDNEHSNLLLLLNEIFGVNNFVTNFIWQKKKGGGNDSRYVAVEHEYVVTYVKNKKDLAKWFLPYDEKYIKRYKEEDEKGKYFWDTFMRASGKQYYPITCPDGTVLEKDKNGNPLSWLRSEARFYSDLEKGEVRIIKVNDEWTVHFKQYASQGKKPRSVLKDLSTNSDAKTLLFEIFGKQKIFDYSKPYDLISSLCSIITDENDIILDSFAGSGTTAHAVLNLNKQDGGNRKFILVEMEDYANDITAERVKRVAKGYGEGKKAVEGTGGAFDYYELGLPLFDDNENLNEEVGIEKIREYIWFSETRTSIYDFGLDNQKSEITNPKSAITNHQYFLGEKDGTVYYFIYEKDRLTTLDFDALELIKTKGEQYIIYADNCLLPKEFMAKKNIIFKKIPRDITKF
jgi:adenine-specific DNA-methyltransferase